MKILTFLGTLILSAGWVFGNPSLSREDLEPILKTNPLLAKAMTGALVLDEDGSAIQLEADFGNLAGRLIGPYRFGGTILNGGERVIVTLYTSVECLDASGQKVEFEAIKPETVGLTLNERFLRYEVSEEPPKAVEQEDQMEQPEKPSGIQWENIDLVMGEGESASARRGILEGSLRELEVNYEEGEFMGWTFQIVYDENRLPSKVIAISSTSRTDSANEPVDEIKTRLLEFKNAQLVKISASEQTNADGIPVNFESMRVTSMAAKRVYLTASQMRTEDPRFLARLIQDAIDAQTRLTEPMITAQDPRWKPVDLGGRIIEVDSAVTTSAAAMYFLRQLGLLPNRQEQKQPAYLWTDLVSLQEGITHVLITAKGYQDDEMEGERFLVSIVQADGGWRLQAIGRQIKKWQGIDWE